MSCSRTQHGDACGDGTQDLSIRSPTLYHYATALPQRYYDENALFSFIKDTFHRTSLRRLKHIVTGKRSSVSVFYYLIIITALLVKTVYKRK